MLQLSDQGQIDAGPGGEYLRAFELALESGRVAGASGDSLLPPISGSRRMIAKSQKPTASWIFSAIAEDRIFLTPIKAFRVAASAAAEEQTPDLKALLVCFLAIEGLRSMNLFDSDVLSADERRLLVSALLEIAG